jgi:hypothetical protein
VAAAVARDAHVEMFALRDRSRVMPFAIYLREDGVFLTGDVAARRAVSNPDRVAKRRNVRVGLSPARLKRRPGRPLVDLVRSLS